MSDDDLARLARRLGVASSYLDMVGTRHDIAMDTRRALVEALGFPVASQSQIVASLEEIEDVQRRPLPPWFVIEAGRGAVLDLAPAFAARITAWQLVGERGFSRSQREHGRVSVPALEAGYYELHIEGPQMRARTFVLAAPKRCWTAPAFVDDATRGWGLTAQVYGLRSVRNAGIGDFADIANLARAAGQSGASFLGLSPLHALFTSDRSKISPYSPSTRLFLEPLFLALDELQIQSPTCATKLVELAPAIARLREAQLVDYASAWALKRPLLELIHAEYLASGGDAEVEEKRAAFGEALQKHATFEALSEYFLAQGQNWAGVWPAVYFDSSSDSVRRFAEEHGARVGFHAWLQVLCDAGLARASAAARESGMELGLYRDLAVGVDRFGSEVWAAPERYAVGLSVGAPPDPLGPQGQNWGFPPFHPLALEAQNFAGFRDLVSANMRHAGAIRIDHAFQLQRLFLVPPRMSPEHGGYVAFPFEALLAILRIESVRHHCMVIAEDLGTGPAGFSRAIMKSGILSYRVLSFERRVDGGFLAPEKYPRNALAAITTHDLPTFRGWLRGFDIDLRSCFGVFHETEAKSEHVSRARDVKHWQSALRAQGLSGAIEDDTRARNNALLYLAQTPSMLVAVQAEDVLDEINQANLPGLSEGPPNWRRRLSETIEHLAQEGGPLGKTGALMAGVRRSPRASASRLASPPPRATYRLQFHAGFTFDMARKILPYLKQLGISHIYASPIQKASPGSSHNYDIVDPREINPELGGQAGFDRFCEDLAEQGLKLLLDIVPNHMAAHAQNPFWMSVLEWGEVSPFAHVFDIDFERAGTRRKILLPVLDRPYGEALDAGALQLAFDVKLEKITLRHHDGVFPICPRDYGVLLKPVARLLGLASRLVTVFTPLLRAYLDLRGNDSHRVERAASLGSRVAKLAAVPQFRAALDDVLAEFSQDHDALDEVLGRQAYRLAHWRLAATEINYRRFFEINNLVGVRVEEPEVFDLTHELILELVEKQQVQGLRVDHIDGLADPAGYLTRLQARVGPGFYIVAEKILASGEELKPWALAGTTGYDALNELDGLFVHEPARESFQDIYRNLVGQSETYAEALAQAKADVLARSFTAEHDAIVTGFYALAQDNRHLRDMDRLALQRALSALIVALPVYRTYGVHHGPDGADDALIAAAVARARLICRPGDANALTFVERVLRGQMPARAEQAAKLRVAFEQLSGPVMAKGAEDMAFYRHVACLALNEVGGDPSRFGFTPDAFHARARARAHKWPASLIATATHDTKRGEDARARLLVLTAAPVSFARHSQRFLALAKEIDANDAYLLLQSLIGAWPLQVEREEGQPFPKRAQAFFIKALREGKRHSSWSDPDLAYEAHALACLDAALDPQGETFALLQSIVAQIAWPGALNGLARTILKLSMPGVPDFYQGAEFWDFAFVDPDNRKAVDFELCATCLAAAESTSPQTLLATWEDGRIKQWLLARLLAHRAQHPDLYAFGDYQPRRNGVGIAFERVAEDQRLYVCAPSGTDMAARGLLQRSGTFNAPALWQDSMLRLEEGLWRNLLTGAAFAVQGPVACVDIAQGLPWLILGKDR